MYSIVPLRLLSGLRIVHIAACQCVFISCQLLFAFHLNSLTQTRQKYPINSHIVTYQCVVRVFSFHVKLSVACKSCRTIV